jgi:hypothetical protein
MEKTRWTDHVRNDELLHRVKEERNILGRVNRRKADLIGHRVHRNGLLKYYTEGKIKGMGGEEEDVSSLWLTLRKRDVLEFEGRRTS